MSEPSGSWKEGRVGAVSLCYLTPNAQTLDWVMRHHAAVGIRATLAGAIDSDNRQRARARNWDLAALSSDPEALRASEPAGLVSVESHPAPAKTASPRYRLIRRQQHVTGPAAIDPGNLPMQPAPAEVTLWRTTIDRIASAGGWSIWALDEAALSTLGPANHQALLTWLGSEHARIWCAPVGDIADWAD